MKLAPILTLAFSAVAKPVAGQCVTGITGFTLIAADSNSEIGALAGMNFALNDPSFLYNIRADFEECNLGETIESVRFFFDGVEERCENFTPYAWLGDPSTVDLGDIGDFNGAPIAPGMHTIQAIPYPENDCTGAPFEPLEDTFQVCTDECPGKITGFTLIDPTVNQAVGVLESFDIQGPINVRADFEECDKSGIESVQFYVNGEKFSCENWEPYALFGDDNPNGPDLGLLGAFYDGFLTPGTHSIRAVPHARKDCKGTAGCEFEQEVTIGCSDCPGSITGFTVIDSIDDSEIGALQDFDFASFQAPVNVRANFEACSKSRIDSVAFYLDNVFVRCEEYSPYALFGDENPNGPDLGDFGAFYDGFFTPGPHTITAVPFDRPNCAGQAGCPLTEDFEVDCANCPGEITGFTLVDAKKDEEIAPLENFDFEDLGTSELTIRADVSECRDKSIDSVQFFYDGVKGLCENFEPYALMGDPSTSDLGPIGDFNAAGITAGDHTITAVPYSGANCMGDAGCPLSQTFSVASSGCPGYVSSLELWTVRGQRKAGTITNGAVFCRSKVRGRLAIRAETVSCSGGSGISSVKFGGSFRGSDDSENYFYPSDLNLGPWNWIRGIRMSPGNYEITATPFSGDSASGEDGVTSRAKFTIARC